MADRYGAYGLHLGGIEGRRGRLALAPEAWPTVHLVRERVASGATPERVLSASMATLPYLGGAWAELDRSARTARVCSPLPVGDDELAHPLLSPIAAVFARWDGREAVHAGAVVGADGAWAVCGPRGAGKSTMLAGLALSGLPLVADDLLVIDGGRSAAGPPSIDLRPDALGKMTAFGGASARSVRGGARQRLEVAAASAWTPLRGILHLEWADRAEVAALGAAERVRRLAPNRASGLEDAAPERALALFALPAWRVARPRDGELQAAVDRVRQLIG